MKADVAIITALPKELDAVLQHGEKKYSMGWSRVESARSIRTYYRSENKVRTRIVAVQASGMGQLNAAIVTADVINDFSPKVILLVGIAAGIKEGVNLGDVVISEQIIDYEPGKLTDGGAHQNFPVYASTQPLLTKLREYRDQEWKVKVLAARPDGNRSLMPEVHYGDIFCGNKVVADGQMVAGLKEHFRKAIALEMESAGIAALLNQRDQPPYFAMVKAICDRADRAKDDRWQEYAADAAASFTLGFLESYQLVVGAGGIVVPPPEEVDKQVERVIQFVAPDLHAMEEFQRDLVEKIVTAGLKEANDVLSGRYQADVGLGRHFLLRAGPLFGKASRIYATSLDTVSTFWTNPDNRAEAGEYLSHQAPGGVAMRLFVFSDADTTHYHARVLDRHEESYRYVFVCSMTHYLALMRDVIPPGGSVDRIADRDFAVLCYGHPKVKQSLFAELDSRYLGYEGIDLDTHGKVIYRRFTSLLDGLRDTPPGEFDRRGQILRWRQGMWQDREKWAHALQTMFNERTADAIHMVFFQSDDPTEQSLRQLLAGIKRRITTTRPNEFQSMTERYGIKRVWIGRRMADPKVRDGVYQGLITTTPPDAGQYVLILRFDTEDGLKRFYADKGHSAIRQQVFETLDPRIKALYAATRTGPLATEAGKATAYEAIEAMAGQFLRRYDYHDDEMIQEMVATVEPYPF